MSSSTPRTGFFASVRDALRGVEQDYTTLPLRRAILLLAVPMVLEMAMESVFAVVDVWFVNQLGRPAAVAAVGLTESVLTLVYAVAIGLSMAVTATVARRIGEGDRDGAVRTATQAVGLGLLIGVALGVPGFLYPEAVLRLMDASPEVIAEGAGYTRLMLGFNVVIVLLFLHNAIFRGAGDPMVAMKSLWLANGINLVLDPCLIFGLGPFPELGVTGAALATVIGRGTGVIYQIVALRRGHSRVRLAGPACRFDLGAALRLLRLSLGGVGQFLVATASWVVLMRIVAPFGDAALAGYTIAIRILVFAIMPAWGLASAAATLVGQNLGAGHVDRAEQSVWTTGIYNMLCLGAVTVVFVFFAEELVGIFSSDAAVVATAASALRIISYGYVFYAWGMVMTQAFNGAGDTVTPTHLNLLCFWGLQIPLAYLLARSLGWGPTGVFWAVTVSESVLAAAGMVLFKRGRWKSKVV